MTTIENEKVILQSEIQDLLKWHQIAIKYAIDGNTCEKGWSGFTSSSEGGCKDYHGYFPWLDALGVVSSPYRHMSFYESTIFQATVDKQGNEEPSFLVMGLATPAMADVVKKSMSTNTKLVVADICPTPLAVCREALEIPRENLFVVNALDLEALVRISDTVGKFSGIGSDAFLTRFDNEQKEVVLSNFSKILKPKIGTLITTWKIGEGGTGNTPKHYGDEISRKHYIENIEHYAGVLNTPLDFDKIQAVMRYAERMTSYSGQSVEEIRDMLEKHFKHVSVEISELVHDVDMRKYARVFAQDPII